MRSLLLYYLQFPSLMDEVAASNSSLRGVIRKLIKLSLLIRTTEGLVRVNPDKVEEVTLLVNL
jgi:hypothetical protein